MIDTYTKAKECLDSFIDYERKVKFSYKKKIKLSRMLWLLEALGIPYQKLKTIHIAGTKGKGSTAHACSHILAASGLRVGLYTSPHFFDFRERIQIVKSKQAGVFSSLIEKKEATRIVNEFRCKLDKLKAPKSLGQISFFEFYTAVAFKYFLDKKVDIAVLETGLGGRLDATNVITPLVSIITHIGYDHTDKLGKSLAKIAREKAGIIKKNTPLVCSSQESATLGEIKKKCRVQNAPFDLFGKDFIPENIRLKKDHTLFDFKSKNYHLKDIKINLKGKKQVENVCCALSASLILKERGVIKKGLEFRKSVNGQALEGRFEVMSPDEPLVIVDIAHNPSSFSVLNDNLKFYFPNKRIILIFSCAQDKDVKEMFKEIEYSHLILTKFSNSRAYEPEQIKRIAKLKEAAMAKDIKGAFALAKKIYTRDYAIVISGSLFLVAEAKKSLVSYRKQIRCRGQACPAL